MTVPPVPALNRPLRAAALVVTALATAAAGVLAVPSAARAATGSDAGNHVAVSVANQRMTAGCRSYAYTVVVKALAGQTWSFGVEATSQKGEARDRVAGTGPGTVRRSVLLCGSIDGPGQYVFTGSLTTDPLYEEDGTTVADEGGTYAVRTYAYFSAPTKTLVLATHKKFKKKHASKKHPHTYRVKAAATVFGEWAMIDGPYKGIRVQYRKAGKHGYRTIKSVGIKDATGVATTKVKITKKGRLRVAYVGGLVGLSSVSRSVAVR